MTKAPTRAISSAAASAAATAAPLNLAHVRQHFPALAIEQDGRPIAFFDNPGGTQVPQSCIDGIVAYLKTANANTYGAFLTARRTVDMLEHVHAGMADLLNAADPREIAFGPNMTTLTFALSRAIGRTLHPGDEIVITALDHAGNIDPWALLAEDRGLTLRVANVDLTTCTLDMADLKSKITARTKLVAVGYASNAAGTINDVATVVGWAKEVGALSFIDAVQFAPHGPIDVQALGCDFLACSAYKFFAPHLGILYARLPLFESLQAYKVRPASDDPPGKWEVGTQNHECLAGLLGTLDYLAELGHSYVGRYGARFPNMSGRRLELHAAMAAIQDYERSLAERLLIGLKGIPNLRIYGLTAKKDLVRRVPTVMVTAKGHTPRQLAEALGARGIFCWDGNYYALALMERLGLEERGGALRIGAVHYNTPAEVDRLLAALREIVDG